MSAVTEPGLAGRGAWHRLGRAFGKTLGVRRTSLLRHVAFDAFGIVLDRNAVLESARGARQIFGEAALEGAATDRLIARLGAATEPVPVAMRALLHRGVAFRLAATLAENGHFEVIGSPHGAVCLLSVRPLVAAPADGTDAALLRAALAALPVPVAIHGPDGSTIWRNTADAERPATGALQRDVPLPGGGYLRVLDTTVTGMDKAETALRRFVETVSETFAHLRVGLAIFDRDRRLTLSNPALAEMFHVEPRWLGGRPTLREMLDRLRESRQLPEHADFPAWRATLFTLFDSGGGNYEEIWELPDGRSLQVLGRPHPVGGIAFVFEDITESLALQRWRSTAMEVRRATLDLLADGVVVFGADGRVRIANPAFMAQWGLRQDEVPSLHVAQIAATCGRLCRDVPLWDRVRAAVASGVGRQPWEARVTLTDGRVLKARVAPMPDGSTLLALADVTDSEQVAAALRDRAAAFEAAEQMRDTLVDHLSHRLRTPLNAVVGFAEMLGEGRAGVLSEMQAGFVSNIRRAARQLVDGIESLGDLASIQTRLVLRVGGTGLRARLGRDQRHNRAWARAKTSAWGQALAMAMRMRRTLRVTWAPILSSLSRMVPQVARSSVVWASARRRRQPSAHRPWRRTTGAAGWRAWWPRWCGRRTGRAGTP
jgi:PAS domain-containing protein